MFRTQKIAANAILNFPPGSLVKLRSAPKGEKRSYFNRPLIWVPANSGGEISYLKETLEEDAICFVASCMLEEKSGISPGNDDLTTEPVWTGRVVFHLLTKNKVGLLFCIDSPKFIFDKIK